MRIIIVFAILLILPTQALAHTTSESYLSIEFSNATASGRWDIALNDLEFAVGIDVNGNGEVTWGELQARQQVIANYAFSRLQIQTKDGSSCAILPEAKQQIVQHRSDPHAVLYFQAACPGPPTQLTYGLLFDLDSRHRGLITLPQFGHSRVVRADNRRLAINAAQTNSRWGVFSNYWVEGVGHILTGIDHLLFLLVLLIPTVLWAKTTTNRQTLYRTAGLVSAFSLGHSITLSAAVIGWVTVPTYWIEIAIALTVIIAALNNVRPFMRAGWPFAVSVGLLHGFGFAAALANLGLTGAPLGWALLGFNAGVECGQFVAIGGALPILLATRNARRYQGTAIKIGSLAIALLGALWLIERSA